MTVVDARPARPGPRGPVVRDDVTLRPVRIEDWPIVHEWARLPDIPRHQPWGPNRALQTRAFVLEAIEAADARPQLRHVLAGVLANRVVGLAEVTVTSTHRGHPDQAEVGYAVHPSMRRQGVGSTIAALATDHAFGRLQVHRVQARVDPRNTGSVRVLETVGYRLDGTLRQDVRLADRWRDTHVFSLLEEEWPGLRTSIGR